MSSSSPSATSTVSAEYDSPAHGSSFQLVSNVGKLQAEFGCHRPHHVVAVQHELTAPLDNTAQVTGNQFLGPDAPAHTVRRLQDHHLMAGLRYPVRRQQASEPRPHHHNPHARFRPSAAHRART